MLRKMRIWLYGLITCFKPWYLRNILGMDIGKNVSIARKAVLDRTINPSGIHIGDNTWIANGVVILSHDYCRTLKVDTYIGKRCFIGLRAIILPGVHIGDDVIIGAGSVVTKDIPSNCVAVGNPAKVVKENVKLSEKGQVIS